MIDDTASLLGDSATLTPEVGNRDHVLGIATAPITLVEYGDYESASRQAWQVVEEVRGLLGDELRFVFRHFVPDGGEADPATAEAVEAAGAQGKFWEMHALLCRSADTPHDRQYTEDARRLGLNLEQFERTMAARAFAVRIRQDTESGIAGGVQSAPTFFINGVLYHGRVDAGWLTQTMQQAFGA
jgi:protein-disulfide isomerase